MIATDSFQFPDLSIPIRDDIPLAFRRSWQHIAKPGCGWTGKERVAIAAQCRAAWDCELCAKREAALSPNSIPEQHSDSQSLPAVAIEAVHRITTDPGRLTEDWFNGLMSGGLTDSQYVEIIGVVGTVLSIDTFCLALGIPIESLPVPLLGEPSGYRPERLKQGGSWLPLLMENDLPDSEADIYAGLRQSANVLRAMSLVPDEVRNLLQISEAMYLSDRAVANYKLNGGRAISRDQIETLSSRISILNDCFY